MNKLVNIIEEGQPYSDDGWLVWKKCRSDDVDNNEIVTMAVYRWIRERGGVPAGQPLSVMVYVWDETMPVREDGQPPTCQGYRVNITKQDAPQEASCAV